MSPVMHCFLSNQELPPSLKSCQRLKEVFKKASQVRIACSRFEVLTAFSIFNRHTLVTYVTLGTHYVCWSFRIVVCHVLYLIGCAELLWLVNASYHLLVTPLVTGLHFFHPLVNCYSGICILLFALKSSMQCFPSNPWNYFQALIGLVRDLKEGLSGPW